MNFIHTIDTAIYNAIYAINSTYVTNTMLIVTNFASAICFISLVMISFIVFKGKRESRYILLNLILVFLLNTIIKIVVARPRPNILRIVEETGYSFPSAHSMVSIAFYGFIIYLINEKLSGKRKIILTILVSLLIVIIGISRIYLGVHYATDVIGGFIIGIVYLLIFIKFIWKKKEKTIEN